MRQRCLVLLPSCRVTTRWGDSGFRQLNVTTRRDNASCFGSTPGLEGCEVLGPRQSSALSAALCRARVGRVLSGMSGFRVYGSLPFSGPSWDAPLRDTGSDGRDQLRRSQGSHHGKAC